MSRDTPKGVESRRAALKLLDAVLRQGLPMDVAAASTCNGLKREDDRRFAVAMAGEVFRRMLDYDALIDSATKRNLPDDAKPRMVLRLALAQALALGTPPHAAISTALPLLAGGPRRLAHGVFGTLMRGEAKLPDSPTLPDHVAYRWRENWGDAILEAAAKAITNPPPLDLTLADPAQTDVVAANLGGKSLLPGHVRLDRQAVTTLPGFEEGGWWVQDIAASIPARLLGQGEGKRALDLCAAPGGKTLQLAAQGWAVTALDNAANRLARLSENLERTKLSATLVKADVFEWKADEPYDVVLLDAPCSATGIFRRHPDVLYRADAEIIAQCAEAQMAMLDRAAGWVKPGGRLVYAVCSLEPDEGEAVIEAFLQDHGDYAIDAIDSDVLPDGITSAVNGALRILPGMIADLGGADGFFIARFRRE